MLLALLLQTVLPAIAAAASDSGSRWTEVCAASGVKWVKLDQGSAAEQHAATDHCVLCAATGAAPEFDVSRYLKPSLPEAQASSPPAAAFPTYPGHSLRSRAPPHLS